MDFFDFLTMIGGLALFLYGMHLLGEGLAKVAGGKFEQILEKLTDNPVKAVFMGAGVTAVIQSSSAATVMVVGFVSAGVLNLTQAVGVIMGANIGTTITAWIVSLSQIGSAMEVMKPAFYAPLLIGIGAIMILFSKKQKYHTVGEILVGLGLLFMGLEFMSDSIAPYTDAPIFSKAFEVLGGNPFLGMLIGALVTALLQSSSASVGILQTLALNGVVTTNAAIYITLGQNIGSCVTAMLSSMGGSRTAKRAAVMHLSFNIIGALVFGVLGFAVFMLYPSMAVHEITAMEISMFHTVFNLTNTAILFPFADQLVKLSGIFVKETKEEQETEDEETVTLKHLDERIFESPAFAVETAALEVIHMGQITMGNVKRGIEAIITGNLEEIEEVYKVEKTIDAMEKMLTEYLIKIDNLSLTEHQKVVVNDLFYSVSDIERVGDHAENLADSARYLVDHKLGFSETGIADLREISASVFKSFGHAIEARRTGSMDEVRKVSQYEDQVDSMEEDLREKHIERLSSGECEPSSGVIFLDIISNLERISDHAYNLAGYIKNEL